MTMHRLLRLRNYVAIRRFNHLHLDTVLFCPTYMRTQRALFCSEAAAATIQGRSFFLLFAPMASEFLLGLTCSKAVVGLGQPKKRLLLRSVFVDLVN